MPKRVPAQELEAIVSITEGLPQGGSLEEIDAALKSSQPPILLARRTLQRRLLSLIEENRLRAEGETRGTRYYSLRDEDITTPVKSAERQLSVSKAGESVRCSVRGPLYERKPVGYRREFLDAYHPNITFYLLLPIRQKLAAIGHTPSGDLPAGTYIRQICIGIS